MDGPFLSAVCRTSDRELPCRLIEKELILLLRVDFQHFPYALCRSTLGAETACNGPQNQVIQFRGRVSEWRKEEKEEGDRQ